MSEQKPNIDVPEDGLFLVKGLKKLTDADGNPIAMEKDVIALCRCGASENKPFCDGTHSDIGFSGKKERTETYPVREYKGKELTVGLVGLQDRWGASRSVLRRARGLLLRDRG